MDASDEMEKQYALNAIHLNTTLMKSLKNASFAVPSTPTAMSAQEHPPALNAYRTNISSTVQEHANSA